VNCEAAACQCLHRGEGERNVIKQRVSPKALRNTNVCNTCAKNRGKLKGLPKEELRELCAASFAYCRGVKSRVSFADN